MSTTNTDSNYKYEFIGRDEEINTFKDVLKTNQPRKALYIEADGGIGKTKLLNKFIEIGWKEGFNADPTSNQNILIDFYNLSNRTLSGLMRSIANKIGSHHFPNYFDKDRYLSNLQTLEEDGKKENVTDLEAEMQSVFLNELNTIDSSAMAHKALFFDTFEKVSKNEAGRWFIRRFVPIANRIGFVIVFAGRKSISISKELAITKSLKNFSRDEFRRYMETHHTKYDEMSKDKDFYLLTNGGNPLLVELMEFTKWPNINEENPEKDLEGQLVRDFINVVESEPYNKLMLEMAYLKHGYTERIFNHRLGKYKGIKDWEDVKKQIKYPFVKSYDSDNVFVLHDKFQDMIEAPDRRRGALIDTVNDLYEDVVKNLYETMIAEEGDDNAKSLLRAEQLSYILNYDTPDWELAKEKILQYHKQKSYNLNSFLVSEISATDFNNCPDELKDELLSAFGDMAEKLHKYEEARSFWQALLDFSKSHNNYKRYVDASIRLYINTWRDDPKQSFKILNEALPISQEHAPDLLPRIYNALGHNLNRLQLYKKAIGYFKKAMDLVPSNNLALKAIILNNLGNSYMENGDMTEAKDCIIYSIGFRQEIIDSANGQETLRIESARIGIGLSHELLGKLARYSGDLDEADGEYTQAVSILENTSNYSVRVTTLLERSETYRRIARSKFEKKQFDVVNAYDEKAEKDIQEAYDLCLRYGLLNLLDTISRRRGRLLHDRGYRSVDTEKKLEYFALALKEFEDALRIARDTGDAQEELENLREIAFLADDHADAIVKYETDSAKIKEEYVKLESYIRQFRETLQKRSKEDRGLYNQNVFEALLTLEMAAFMYARQELDEALTLYLEAFVKLAKSPGYGVSNYLTYLPHLRRNLQNLKNPTLQRAWCDKIMITWKKHKLDKIRYEMVSLINVHLLSIGKT